MSQTRQQIIDTHSAQLYEDLLESVRKPTGRLWFDMCQERIENCCYETGRELVDALKQLQAAVDCGYPNQIKKAMVATNTAIGNASYEKFRKREGK